MSWLSSLFGKKKTTDTSQQSTSTSSNTSSASLTPWSMDQFTQGRDDINKLFSDYNTQHPYTPYTGELTAPLSGLQTAARTMATSRMGVGGSGTGVPGYGAPPALPTLTSGKTAAPAKPGGGGGLFGDSPMGGSGGGGDGFGLEPLSGGLDGLADGGGDSGGLFGKGDAGGGDAGGDGFWNESPEGPPGGLFDNFPTGGDYPPERGDDPFPTGGNYPPEQGSPFPTGGNYPPEQGGPAGSNPYDEAAAWARQGAGANWTPDDVAGPDKVAYRTFDPNRVRARYNPYEQDVIDSSSKLYDEDLQGKIRDNQARATMSGAFGGSRHGVADAELERGSALDKANFIAGLKSAGWDKAVAGDDQETQGLFAQDEFNSQGGYDAQKFNATNRNDATKYNIENRLKGSQILGDLAGKGEDSWMKQVNLLDQLGASDREIQQAKDLAQKAQYDDQAADAWQRFQAELQARLGLQGQLPLLTSSTSTGSTTGASTGREVTRESDPMGQIASLLKGIAALGVM